MGYKHVLPRMSPFPGSDWRAIQRLDTISRSVEIGLKNR
jgi:hypothetical protein